MALGYRINLSNLAGRWSNSLRKEYLKCLTLLNLTSEAMICSYECTYCVKCADPETSFQAYKGGAPGLLEKPFTQQTIILMVKSLLENLFLNQELGILKSKNAKLKIQIDNLLSRNKMIKNRWTSIVIKFLISLDKWIYEINAMVLKRNKTSGRRKFGSFCRMRHLLWL